MRMRAPHGRDASIEKPAHGELLARRLGVHIDEDHARLIFREQSVHRRERVIGVRIERKPPQKIDDADGAERRCIRRVAPAGALGSIVCRAQDARFLVKIWLQFPARPRVVAKRHNIRSGGKDGVRLCGRNADNIGVFTVHHREGNALELLERL